MLNFKKAGELFSASSGNIGRKSRAKDAVRVSVRVRLTKAVRRIVVPFVIGEEIAAKLRWQRGDLVTPLFDETFSFIRWERVSPKQAETMSFVYTVGFAGGKSSSGLGWKMTLADRMPLSDVQESIGMQDVAYEIESGGLNIDLRSISEKLAKAA